MLLKKNRKRSGHQSLAVASLDALAQDFQDDPEKFWSLLKTGEGVIPLINSA